MSFLNAKRYTLNASRGFTLVEVLVSLAVLAIISVIGLNSFSTVNTGKALDIETEKVISLIAKARALTLSAKDGAAYGVHFEERKTVLFKGPTYSAGASGNQEQALNDAVRISAVALTGGGAEVLFAKLTGATAQSGTVALAAVRDASKTRVITIAATGVAYSN
ncbi:MAG TPA: prepilin-type N-terminal cleavage/methylation domain-containing protein [Candidatus Paceibacterota bacterium]